MICMNSLKVNKDLISRRISSTKDDSGLFKRPKRIRTIHPMTSKISTKEIKWKCLLVQSKNKKKSLRKNNKQKQPLLPLKRKKTTKERTRKAAKRRRKALKKILTL